MLEVDEENDFDTSALDKLSDELDELNEAITEFGETLDGERKTFKFGHTHV
jgi:hypothetical protein